MEYTIRRANEQDKFGVARLILSSFGDTFYDPYISAMTIFHSGFDDNDLVMIIDGSRVGYHSFIERSLDDYTLNREEFKPYKGKKGIQGHLFCIHPNFQRMGLGTKFIQFERVYFKGKYDYIWGDASWKLNNYGFWLKNRDLLIENRDDKGVAIGVTSIQNLW